jgi:two-component system sensor histidine kinase QseC
MMQSLQGRLLVWVLGSVLLVALSTVVAVWYDARHELDELLDGHLAQAAALLVVQQSGNVEAADEEDHRIDAPQLHRYAPRVAFQVWHDRTLTMRSSNAPITPMIETAVDQRSAHAGFVTVDIGGREWRVFAAHDPRGELQVFVGEQIASRAEILVALLRGTITPLALALPLLALVVWWAVRQGIQPMSRLSALLAERAPQAVQPVAVGAAPSEMQPLIDALNGLLARIGEMVHHERRFTADAAHELRTPIAAIRAQAQVALAESDAGDRRHALLATVQGCDRATRLVEQLLTLSRLETGAEPATTLVDLAALARQTAREIGPAAAAKRQSISLDAPAACPVRGDETLLAVLLRNLLDNAVRYSPPGASVAASLQVEAGRVTLHVHDSGPGLAEADAQRLGERFFRVLGNDEPGSGLGWSIVRRIADAHGAQVMVTRSATLGGLAVSIGWPAAAPAPADA